MRAYIFGIIFVVWVCMCGIYYCAGPRGFFAIRGLRQFNNQLVAEIAVLNDRVEKLKRAIMQWNEEPFFKEQLAREQLQLVRPDDTVYYIV